MSTYYGAVMGGSSRTVLCHTIEVETYTRTLPNGKTITVKGYRRVGNAAKETAQAKRNSLYDQKAAKQVSSARQSARSSWNDARFFARTAKNSSGVARSAAAETAAKSAYGAAKSLASGYASAAQTKAEQLGYNARNAWSDAKETMSAAWSTFKEEASFAASYVGACVEVGINWIKNLLGLGGSKDSNRESNSPSGSARSTGSKPAKVLETQKSSTGVFNRTSPSPRVVRSTGGSRGNYIDRPNRLRR